LVGKTIIQPGTEIEENDAAFVIPTQECGKLEAVGFRPCHVVATCLSDAGATPITYEGLSENDSGFPTGFAQAGVPQGLVLTVTGEPCNRCSTFVTDATGFNIDDMDTNTNWGSRFTSTGGSGTGTKT